MRYLIAVFALVLALGVTLSAQAKVQNVKVGGDVQIRSISRTNFDLNDSKWKEGDDVSWFDSVVRLQVSADLTNDVGAVIRLINERDWNAAVSGTAKQGDNQNVQLDLGYITLDNMFGYPVKATLGRQEILFGEGFLIGDGYNGVTTTNWLAYGESIRAAFDALRLTYSAKPYTVDIFTAKLANDFTQKPIAGDTNLRGININYAYLDIATFDLGYFVKNNGNTGVTRASDTKALSLSGKGSIPSVPGLTLKGEYVWEGGSRATGNATERDLNARAWYTGAKYTLQDNPYQPYFGATYLFKSGDKYGSDVTKGTGDYNQFDSLYPDFEDFGTIANLLDVSTGNFNDTNLKAWKLTAGLKPTEALSLDLAYVILKRDKTLANVDDALGNELDAFLTYDYTEDVQFGLSAAWFNPGDYFKEANKVTPNVDSTATQIVGSVTVSF